MKMLQGQEARKCLLLFAKEKKKRKYMNEYVVGRRASDVEMGTQGPYVDKEMVSVLPGFRTAVP